MKSLRPGQDFIKGAGNKSSVAGGAHEPPGPARHRELAAATGVRVYFCDPHSPWQRAGCENTNGLLRQYLPKGTDLSVYTQEELDAIADSLNNRPRQTLGWDTPMQVFSRTLANARSSATGVH